MREISFPLYQPEGGVDVLDVGLTSRGHWLRFPLKERHPIATYVVSRRNRHGLVLTDLDMGDV